MKLKKVCREFLGGEEKPFASAHASTVLPLADGDVLASWFAGSWEGAEDVVIYLARRSAGKWSEPRVVSDHVGIPHWNPVLFYDTKGRIHLVYKIGRTIPGWVSYGKYSDDGGKTWSEARELVTGDIGGRGPVKNKAILRSDGVILAPASVETYEQWDAFVDFSRDCGQSWEESARIPVVREKEGSNPRLFCSGKGIIQPTLWESSPMHIHALLRSTASEIFRSDSEDGGETWCPAYRTGLVHNNSGIDLVKTDGGCLLLVHNPVENSEGEDRGPRSPLVISTSDLSGTAWEVAECLEQEKGEFSYPAITYADGCVHVTYTWNRQDVVYCAFYLED